MGTNPKCRVATPPLLAMQIVFLAAISMTPFTGNFEYKRQIPLLWTIFSIIVLVTGLIVAVRYKDPRGIIAPMLSLALMEAVMIFRII